MENETIGIDLNTFQSTSHFFLAVTGIPLNLVIIGVIVSNRRLNQKPRNVLWLGVTLSNLFTLFTILTELVTFHFESVVGCKVFGLSTGVAYTCLLYNVFLSLLDRYLAISHPILHRIEVTIKRVLFLQIGGGIFFFALIKFPFLWIPVQCGFVLIHGQIIGVISMILFIACLAAKIVVYSKARRLGRANRVIAVSFSKRPADNNEDEEFVTVRTGSENLVVHGGNRDMEVLTS